YLIELPFIIIGFVYLFLQKNPLLKLPLVWLFLAPLVASITTDDIPNIQRSLVMFPMLEVIAGFGIASVISSIASKKRVIIAVVISAAFAMNFVYFLHQYVVHSSSHVTIYRFNGFKEM